MSDILNCLRQWNLMASHGHDLEAVEVISAFEARQWLQDHWADLTVLTQETITRADALVDDLADGFIVAFLDWASENWPPDHYGRLYVDRHKDDV